VSGEYVGTIGERPPGAAVRRSGWCRFLRGRWPGGSGGGPGCVGGYSGRSPRGSSGDMRREGQARSL